MKWIIPLLLPIVASPVIADETRELDAHEHGVSTLNIAVEGSTVAMELHAPGADIVGFEYEAKSDEDHTAIDDAVALLGQPLDLFQMPEAAQCSVVKVAAGLEDEHDHDAHDDHAAHDDHDDHAAHDDHDDHAADAQHSEFHAEYVLNCADPSQITEISFEFFETFENAKEVEVQIVTGSGAQAFDVKREDPVLNLAGLLQS